jgi:hypothetical protein
LRNPSTFFLHNTKENFVLKKILKIPVYSSLQISIFDGQWSNCAQTSGLVKPVTAYGF